MLTIVGYQSLVSLHIGNPDLYSGLNPRINARQQIRRNCGCDLQRSIIQETLFLCKIFIFFICYILKSNYAGLGKPGRCQMMERVSLNGDCGQSIILPQIKDGTMQLSFLTEMHVKNIAAICKSIIKCF